jgi:hypothetical protein
LFRGFGNVKRKGYDAIHFDQKGAKASQKLLVRVIIDGQPLNVPE